MDVQIENCQKSINLDLAVWQARLGSWLAQLAVSPRACVGVTLTDDAAIAALNREHRGQDRPTDVLSFPAPADFPAAPRGPVPLGDIVVSVERAQQQAQTYGHSLERELGFLLTHGLLHLLGYDHETPDEEQIMRTRQEEILAATNLNRNQ